MICPKCRRRPIVVVSREGGRIIEARCDYPGCFAGEIHCCEGDYAPSDVTYFGVFRAENIQGQRRRVRE